MYINVLFHNFFPFRFSLFFCSLLSFLGKTFKLRQKWIWWLELHFATLVRLAFRLGRDDDECFPKTFVQIFFPRLFFYFISILKVQNSQKVLMWSSYPQTDKPKHKPWSWNFENAALWFKLIVCTYILIILTLKKLFLYFLEKFELGSCMIRSDFRYKHLWTTNFKAKKS